MLRWSSRNKGMSLRQEGWSMTFTIVAAIGLIAIGMLLVIRSLWSR
jgi:hypothetical protein